MVIAAWATSGFLSAVGAGTLGDGGLGNSAPQYMQYRVAGTVLPHSGHVTFTPSFRSTKPTHLLNLEILKIMFIILMNVVK